MRNLKTVAYQLLLDNVCEGIISGGKEYFYICPHFRVYPYQWAWDSCFNAIAMASFDITLAKKELLTLLSCISDSGFLPSILYWPKLDLLRLAFNKFFYDTVNSTRLIQVPMIGIALGEIYKVDKDKDFLRKALPKATKFYEWIRANRVIDETKLPVIIHPWESLDEGPQFDFVYGFKEEKRGLLVKFRLGKKLIEVLLKARRFNFDVKKISKTQKPFLVKSCLFNTIYAQGLKLLGCLWEEIEERKKGAKFKDLGEKVSKAILEYHYSEEFKSFLDLFGVENEKIPIITISSLMPLMLDKMPGEIFAKLVKRHLLNPEEFWAPYPVPTVPRNSSFFNPCNRWPLWRGPVAFSTNWLLVYGLRKHGYSEVASEIVRRMKDAVERFGFWEFYNPLTGKGVGLKNYSWSALIADLFGRV